MWSNYYVEDTWDHPVILEFEQVAGNCYFIKRGDLVIGTISRPVDRLYPWSVQIGVIEEKLYGFDINAIWQKFVELNTGG